MRTNLKTIAIVTAVIATAAAANARELRKGQAEDGVLPRCPTCGCSRARPLQDRQRPAPELRRQRQQQAVQPRQQHAQAQPNRQQQAGRPVHRPFDINHDGRISPPERAARKAYRQAVQVMQ